MVYNPNIPTAPQKLSVSQPLILGNFQQLDTSFGIDHYKYSDATANNGFHNQVTTPNHSSGADPATVANPVLYALEKTVNLGSLQYSRGPNDAVPTPVTGLHSPDTPLTIPSPGSINILDFTGIKIAICTLYTSYVKSGNFLTESLVKYYFSGSAITSIQSIIGGSGGLFTFSSDVLTMNNGPVGGAITELYWTLKFHRIQKI